LNRARTWSVRSAHWARSVLRYQLEHSRIEIMGAERSQVLLFHCLHDCHVTSWLDLPEELNSWATSCSMTIYPWPFPSVWNRVWPRETKDRHTPRWLRDVMAYVYVCVCIIVMRKRAYTLCKRHVRKHSRAIPVCLFPERWASCQPSAVALSPSLSRHLTERRVSTISSVIIPSSSSAAFLLVSPVLKRRSKSGARDFTSRIKVSRVNPSSHSGESGPWDNNVLDETRLQIWHSSTDRGIISPPSKWSFWASSTETRCSSAAFCVCRVDTSCACIDLTGRLRGPTLEEGHRDARICSEVWS